LPDGALELQIGIVLIHVHNLLIDAFGTLFSPIRLLFSLLLELVLRDVHEVGDVV
jgi:hypothetical protein